MTFDLTTNSSAETITSDVKKTKILRLDEQHFEDEVMTNVHAIWWDGGRGDAPQQVKREQFKLRLKNLQVLRDSRNQAMQILNGKIVYYALRIEFQMRGSCTRIDMDFRLS
ncbi:hypothetical protein QZH41_012208 [Actinostola sp. cb2023]|nr:hypothetical protein QZH41_012208 [Actinostola sp. cb2023]